MRVAITGSSGLIGSALRGSLEADGHTVHPVVRHREQATGGGIYWSPAAGEVDADGFTGVDAVVNLAGEPLGDRRWSDEVKAAIFTSRAEGTRVLADALASVEDPPSVLVSGSAVGYYGDRGDEVLTEADPPGTGFMAELCVAWEEATRPAADAGIRTATIRTGVVMAPDGPLIEKVELPFKLGVGGRVGSGRQWVPWISLDDHVRAMRFLLDHDIAGPVNLVSPEVVRNAELTRELGRVWHRPTILPVPMVAIRIMYGEMGVTLASDSARVVPDVLREAGFEWQYPSLGAALDAALG